jgi:RNA polymerase sigma-70 factor (ECF subfamily)
LNSFAVKSRSLVDSVEAAPSPAPRAALRFEDVYEEYFDFVWRSLRTLGVAPSALDDAAQDAFGVISRRLAGFEGRSSLRTWVFGITHFTAANHRRGERRKSLPLQPLDDELLCGQPGPQQHVEARQLGDLIVAFCAELDEGRRTVFVLGLLEGVPAAEIAQVLGIPVNTVYSRLRTLRDALRLLLEQHGVSP